MPSIWSIIQPSHRHYQKMEELSIGNAETKILMWSGQDYLSMGPTGHWQMCGMQIAKLELQNVSLLKRSIVLTIVKKIVSSYSIFKIE